MAKNNFLSGLNMGKLRQFTYSIDRNKISTILVTPIFDGYQKNQNRSKKAKNDFLRGLNMGKLRQLTYSIDRNKISKILVTPIFDGYQKKFKMALKRPKMTFWNFCKKNFFLVTQGFQNAKDIENPLQTASFLKKNPVF